MADGRHFQHYFYSMHAVGRQFQLGDFYDYRTDKIVKGIQTSTSVYIYYTSLIYCYYHHWNLSHHVNRS